VRSSDQPGQDQLAENDLARRPRDRDARRAVRCCAWQRRGNGTPLAGGPL